MSKILVTFETWTGATRGVAEEVAKTLREDGADVDVIQARKVNDLEAYEAYVIGASIHAGQIPRPLRRLVRRNAQTLAKRPVAYFVVCYTMNEDTPENRETARGYLKPLREAAPEADPVDVGLFAGAVLNDTEDYRRLFPLMKVPINAMAESEGDHRDWDAIQAWAEELSSKLIAS